MSLPTHSNLKPFQDDARIDLLDALDDARHNYARRHKQQIISFTAATGAGKTIILTSLVESVFESDNNYPAQDDAIFIWLSDSSGTGQKISDTDLDECLKTIETATSERFKVGEVVHTFGDAGDLTINGLRVAYVEPSMISGDAAIKIVLFKENLSTGWDCPRAETMMSFRRAVDATYIAQLIGRMIRTPLQRRISTDETLNEVCLFLPKFAPETVSQILDMLKSGEGGAVTNVTAQTLTAIKNEELGIWNDVERLAVLDFINALGLTTYRIKRGKTVKRLAALSVGLGTLTVSRGRCACRVKMSMANGTTSIPI